MRKEIIKVLSVFLSSITESLHYLLSVPIHIVRNRPLKSARECLSKPSWVQDRQLKGKCTFILISSVMANAHGVLSEHYSAQADADHS